jgi:hypothetical protein
MPCWILHKLKMREFIIGGLGILVHFFAKTQKPCVSMYWLKKKVICISSRKDQHYAIQLNPPPASAHCCASVLMSLNREATDGRALSKIAVFLCFHIPHVVSMIRERRGSLAWLARDSPHLHRPPLCEVTVNRGWPWGGFGILVHDITVKEILYKVWESMK